MQPAIFTREERALDAEQWLIDTTDLLTAARILADNQVEVAKIQLKDVARTWWLAGSKTGKANLLGPILEKFYDRFFPKIAQKDMEE